MLLSVTSFWQHVQLQHPSCSPQVYQRSDATGWRGSIGGGCCFVRETFQPYETLFQ